MRVALALAVAVSLGVAGEVRAVPVSSTQVKYVIEEVTHAGEATLVKRATVKTSELGAAFAQMLPAVAAFCKSKHIAVTGAPFARFFKYEPNGITEFETGLPAITAQPLEPGIEASFLPAGRAITTLHKGSYEKIGPAYEALHAWLTENHVAPAGAPWEVYVTDPATTPVADLQTRIYFPIK